MLHELVDNWEWKGENKSREIDYVSLQLWVEGPLQLHKWTLEKIVDGSTIRVVANPKQISSMSLLPIFDTKHWYIPSVGRYMYCAAIDICEILG